ncbi:hypothetical protein NMY22_g19344 [Coprinellus aureogranulatus]|nr:hypothetical protein NMY22_g19344 [Coprinellus aureogranulatus]
MRFTSSALTALFIVASTAVPSLAAPLPTHISSLVPHPDALAPRALSLRSVVALLIPRDVEEISDIESREPCMRGASRPSGP